MLKLDNFYDCNDIVLYFYDCNDIVYYKLLCATYCLSARLLGRVLFLIDWFSLVRKVIIGF